MDYDTLANSYWSQQIQRVLGTLSAIAGRPALPPGSAVPEPERLAYGAGQRLHLAVMFLDICGFSGRPSETAAEQQVLLNSLNLLFTEMVRIVEEYGGTVEKNTGDGLMAYFEDGGGSPPEGGAKRAVSCALTMHHANEKLVQPIFEANRVPPIEFRITIDSGDVTVAKLGAPRRFNSRVAIGTTANIASKMLEFAGPSDVLLGEKAKLELPREWQLQWTRLGTLASGWVYRFTQAPYPFFRYTGRWISPS